MKALRVIALEVSLFTIAACAGITNNLTIVVFDRASVPHSVLVSAANEGRRAFRAAGVETQWILCNPVQGCYVPEKFVQVKILPRPLRTTPISANGLASSTICTATERCSASRVFYDRILRFADDASSPVDITLAYVMVHEIGHVMGLGHRPGGIMTAGFSANDLHRAEYGSLSFAEEDARELRTAVARSGSAGEARHIKVPGWRGEVAE